MTDRINKLERILAAICHKLNLHLCKRCSDETATVCYLCGLPVCADGCCVIVKDKDVRQYCCFECYDAK